MTETINIKRPGDHFFIAQFEDDRVHLYAKNVASARQRAVEHFRPKKKQLNNVWVEIVKGT